MLSKVMDSPKNLLTKNLSFLDHPLPVVIFKQKQVNTSTHILKALNKLITPCVQCYLEEL